MTKVHKLRMQTIPFDRARHAKQGMPICSLCNAKFTRWETLEAHISHQRCTQALPTIFTGVNNDPHTDPALGTPDQPHSPPVCETVTTVSPSVLVDFKADGACCDEVPGSADLVPADLARNLTATAVQSVSNDAAPVACTVALTTTAAEATTDHATEGLPEPNGLQMPTMEARYVEAGSMTIFWTQNRALKTTSLARVPIRT